MAFGMFGQRPRFKTPEPYRTPGIGDGLPGMQPGNGMPQFDPAPDQMAPQPKGGLFNLIGAGTADKLSSIGDILQDVDGGDRFGENQRLRQQMAYQDQQYQRRQADERNTWLWQQQWERDHPKAQQPTAFQSNYEYLLARDPAKAKSYLENEADPLRAVPGVDSSGNEILRFMRPSEMRGGGPASGGPAVGTVEDGYRFKGGDPSKQENWEPASMSPNEAGTVLGGAARTQMISRAQAMQIRQSLGPNGQAAFEKWMRDNGIVIGGN